jgi:hypothetical protein
MSDDKDKAVLAARVLSYLKRKAGKGKQPSAPESKAAATALQLLAVSFPQLSGDMGKLYDKLVEIARKNAEASAIAGLPLEQQAIMTLQAKMQREALMTSILTNIANMKHESLKGIAQNLRG